METKPRPSTKRKKAPQPFYQPDAVEIANGAPSVGSTLFELDDWHINLAMRIRKGEIDPLQAILAATFHCERRHAYARDKAIRESTQRCQRTIAGVGVCGMLLGRVTGSEDFVCIRCDADELAASREGSAA